MAKLTLPIKARRLRRADAKKSGTPFQPQYNENKRTGRGGKPKTYKEMFGVGYERFDDKFTKISEVVR